MVAKAVLAAALGVAFALASGAEPARAEIQIGAYGGINTNFSSRADLDKSGVTDSRTMDWEGKSFEMPPYWGARGTYWLPGSSWGLALDYVHAKAYANLNFATDPIYRHLEFTDGLNLATLNLVYRLDPRLQRPIIPYVGLGAGAAIPHVEVILKASPGQTTWEYQVSGAAAQVFAGVEYPLSSWMSLFAEAKLSYAHVNAELTGGGKLETNVWSPQLALGILFRFGGD